MPNNMMTLPEAADYLGATVRGLRHWISTGQLPAYRLGARAIRVKREDLDAMLQPVTPTKAR